MGLSPRQAAELHELLWQLRAETASPEQLTCLERLVCEDPQARTFYVHYMHLCADLNWNGSVGNEGRETKGEGRGTRDQRRGMAGSPAIDGEAGFGVRDSGFGIQSSESLSAGAAVEHPVGAAVKLPQQHNVELPHQLDLEPQIPEPPFPTLSTTNYPPPTAPFVGSWAFSYMVATVIMGVTILGFWAYKITHHQHIAEAPSQSAPSETRPEMVFVGRITGMVDVKWSDDPRYLPPPGFAHVPLGREYRLDSGLLEITYDTGAKVILQGPCTYEVESTAGGYLSLGKLTARVGARGEGRGASEGRVANQKSPSSLILHPSSLIPHPSSFIPHPSSFIPHPSSLFSVRTPTAVITDLGTEFGVEVDKSGGSKAHVFQGKVEVRLTGGGGEARAIQLGANESARVEPDADRIVVVHRAVIQPGAFARRMPQWTPIELFSTGAGLKERDEDPHWQLVARGDDPNFQPRPAVVTAAHAYWLANYPTRSQWLSTADGPPAVPNVTYTFCTTFELAGALPETAVLRGRFIADNHVQAIRLNGRQLPVPEHGWGRLGGGIFSDGDAFNLFSEFSARKGFVEGANTLEIDVHNGIPPETGGNGAMGLRVELSGHVLSSWQSGDRGQPPRKEGSPMNGP